MMMAETERDEQIAAARRIPKDVTIQVTEPPATYEPAPKILAADQNGSKTETAPVTTVAQNKETAVQTQPVVLTTPKQTADAKPEVASTAPDSSLPQPKAAATSTGSEPAGPRTMDVASAIKSVLAPTTNVASTTADPKQEVAVTTTAEQLGPKSEKSGATEKAGGPPVSVIELGLGPAVSELRVGEKRQLAVEIKSDAPLGMAVVMLRFDPKVLKINSVSAGSLFANAKTAPTITQTIDEHGMLLVSLTPAAGTLLTADGALINLDVEALGAGDSVLTFDLANVHLVASDGRNTLLQIEPIKLTVKQ